MDLTSQNSGIEAKLPISVVSKFINLASDVPEKLDRGKAPDGYRWCRLSSA
jgi:hypothetical protein